MMGAEAIQRSPLMQFVQPTIDLTGRAMALPGQIVQQETQPALETIFGTAVGRQMAQALGMGVGPLTMGIPEGSGSPLSIGPSQESPATSLYSRRGTTVLPELEMEPRFHGSMRPIETVRDPRSMQGSRTVSAEESLYGPGFYTTDNYHVAGGYASPKGVRYRVHEVNPVKFLDMDQPLPKPILDRIGAHPSAGGYRAGLIINQAKDLGQMDEIIRAAEEEGYGGIRHAGGKLSGKGETHDVKIYWRPQRDIRIRPIDPTPSLIRRTSKVAPPQIDPTLVNR